MSLINKALVVSLILMAILLGATESSRRAAIKEKDRMTQNTDALLSKPDTFSIDSSAWVTKIKVLSLKLDEYKMYRADDAKKLKAMGVKLKNLEAVAKHIVTVEAPIDATVKDSTFRSDSIEVTKQIVKMDTPYLKVNGVIESGRMTGDIFIPPVTINQAIWVDYKHKFLWFQWGVNGINQTISSDNPYVKINYSEFIKIKQD